MLLTGINVCLGGGGGGRDWGWARAEGGDCRLELAKKRAAPSVKKLRTHQKYIDPRVTSVVIIVLLSGHKCIHIRVPL